MHSLHPMNESIKQDYFKLLRDLNKSNKTKNENTELYFIIEENKLFAALSKDQKLLLCIRKGNRWLPSNHSLYPNLEEHLSIYLSETPKTTDLTIELKLSIFQMKK